MSDNTIVKNEQIKRMLMLMLSAIVCVVFYVLCLHYNSKIGIIALYIGTSALFVICFYLNGGFSKDSIKKENMPVKWSEERKDRYIERMAKNKVLGKKFMVILLPLLFVVGFDFFYSMFF